MEELKEMLRFVQIGARLDLKIIATEHILGLTGTDAGISAILDVPDLMVSLISLLDDANASVSKDASLCLVNLSASEKGAAALLSLDTEKNCPPLQRPPQNIVGSVLKFVLDPNSRIADPCCMVLSNLTKPGWLNERIIELITESGHGFDELIEVFTKRHHNKQGHNLHYLGPVLSNLSQNVAVRRYILDKTKCVIQRLLPFTEYPDSLVRRGGIVGTLKNCLFEQEFHDWLLSDDVDILPRLLLPLAGNESFSDEENDLLPIELQYLPDDKVREEDPDIRCMLLEALTQLCSTRKGRELFRQKAVYVILREYHKWERDAKALAACENLVDLLIRTEEEIGCDNLTELEIPEKLSEVFQNLEV